LFFSKADHGLFSGGMHHLQVVHYCINTKYSDIKKKKIKMNFRGGDVHTLCPSLLDPPLLFIDFYNMSLNFMFVIVILAIFSTNCKIWEIKDAGL